MLWTLIFCLFLLSAVLQLVYLLGFFSQLAFGKRLESVQSGPHPPISIIICAHNELTNLQALLPALFHQDYPSYEVIVVDDRSRDGTAGWLLEQQLTWKNLKVITISGHPENVNAKKFALLAGIEAAAHDILLLTDADCCPRSAHWIRRMAEKFQDDTQFVLGYSPYEKTSGLLNSFIRYETLVTAIQYLSRAIARRPYMGVGRNLAYRKSYFMQVNGLNNIMHITGGDDDLLVNHYAHGHNTEVCLEEDSQMISRPKNSWQDYIKQKKRHLSVGKHYRLADKLLLGLFSASHIIFWSSLVSLLLTSTHIGWVAGVFVIRLLLLAIIVTKSSRRLGDPMGLGILPFLDFIYTIYYLITGLLALTSRKITWH